LVLFVTSDLAAITMLIARWTSIQWLWLSWIVRIVVLTINQNWHCTYLKAFSSQ